jgi:hypothetical protein
MDELPIEILHLTANYDRSTYLAMLAIPTFARSLTPSTKCDYMIRFGYSVEIKCNEIRWMRNGKLHRTDGPAIIRTDGMQEWYKDGLLHRADGPAIIRADGTQAWYVNGKLHRTDGPAVIYANGSQEWYINDRLHRTDGPAIIHVNGSQEWFIHGKYFTEQEFKLAKS